MSKKVAVIFERTWGAYNSGERAGFEGHVAESLVKGGAARYPEEEARPEPKPKPGKTKAAQVTKARTTAAAKE